jgi:hypothetical protein
MVEIDPNWLLICLGGGVLLGWVLGTIATMSHYNSKVGTPSASHNRQSNVIMPHCKTCSGFDKVSLARCYECKGSKWAPA